MFCWAYYYSIKLSVCYCYCECMIPANALSTCLTLFVCIFYLTRFAIKILIDWVSEKRPPLIALIRFLGGRILMSASTLFWVAVIFSLFCFCFFVFCFFVFLFLFCLLFFVCLFFVLFFLLKKNNNNKNYPKVRYSHTHVQTAPNACAIGSCLRHGRPTSFWLAFQFLSNYEHSFHEAKSTLKRGILTHRSLTVQLTHSVMFFRLVVRHLTGAKRSINIHTLFPHPSDELVYVQYMADCVTMGCFGFFFVQSTELSELN